MPYARNSRTHSDEQISQIASSIKAFGFTNPILVSDGNDIIAGHGRALAAGKLGLDHVPCIRLGHLTERDRRAYVIADNRLALSADWDAKMLELEVAELQAMDFDLDLLGFEEAELDALLCPEVLPEEGLTDPDAVPENVDTRCKPGDLWILGNHRLLCGDSTNVQHVERLMGGEKADMCVTDPPYNVDYGNNKSDKHKFRPIENDNMSHDDFRDFCRGFVGCIAAVVDGCIYVFGPPGVDGRIMFTVLDEAFHCSTTIVWNKDRFVLGRGKYHNKYEPCWFGWNGKGINFVDDRTLNNVWDFPRPAASELHPTMKPVELIENALAHASKPGQVVLDLFGGSGTTLIACEKKGRYARLNELDPKYCDVILTRWEQFTGKTATLEEADGQE